MAHKSASPMLLCVLLLFAPVLPKEIPTIRVTPGETTTLPCKLVKGTNPSVVEWSRVDLFPHVLLFRDGHFHSDDQYPSLQDRVKLTDPQMKDGDMSLVVRDVTVEDSGSYMCYVFTEGSSHRKKRASGAAEDPISIFNLMVYPPGWNINGK
ncbi:butyrophilin subfamily 2 member A1-like isoform 1-T1 [Pholidichthys leucotaenia]